MDIYSNTVIAGHTGILHTELLEARIPTQDQTSQNPSMEEEEAHEALYLAEKLLAVAEGTLLVFFRDMVPEMLCSSRLHYTYTYTGGTKWTQWVF